MNDGDLHLYCADCGAPKVEDPSNMPGDDLCGECREKEDRANRS